MSFYREKILDHYKNPRNFGKLKGADACYHLDNPLCGDAVDVFVKLRNNKVEDIKFIGEGCAISIASMSMLSEKIKGESVEKVLKINQEDITKMLGASLTPTRLKCAMLGLEALRKSLSNK